MFLNRYYKPTSLYFFFLIILLVTLYTPQSSTQIINQGISLPLTIDNGQILFSPIGSKKTYLLDSTGVINRTWSSNYLPGLSLYMLKSGSILRTINIEGGVGGGGGGVECYSYNGTLNWHFEYYSLNKYESHHDIEPLPNGNVLLLAYELKTPNEVINAGRNPDLTPSSDIEFDYIVEVHPTGPTTGDIVWEWHFWDHLIQDYDKSKTNYGDVLSHPELIDINFAASQTDWLHCNSIDYNERFDQILISSRNLNEIYIIDHNTTTEEAAGHIGGYYGKGGDILYRWGDPESYRAGSSNDQKLFGQHDAQWISKGSPGEGNILIFNNGVGRQYSSVDEIVPPVNQTGHYYLEAGTSFEPDSPIWVYTANPPNSFYASHISGCQRLPNGNTLICDGPAGRFFEVTPDKITVWQYVNPYPNAQNNDVFKIQYIPPEEIESNIPDLKCEGSLTWSNVKAGSTVKGDFKVKNIGDNDSLLNWTIDSFPSWGTWSFDSYFGINLTPQQEFVIINVTVEAPNDKNTEFEGYVRVINKENPYDYDLIPVLIKTSKNRVLSFFNDLLKNHPYLFPIIRFLIY